MAVTFRTPSAAFANSTTHTGSRPAGTTSGDLLLAVLDIVSGSTVTPPAGWTLRGTAAANSFTMRTYTKQASGAEPTSYTWTSSSTKQGSLHILAVSGLSATPEDSSIANQSKVGGSVTSVTDGAVLIAAFSGSSDSGQANTWGAPAGMTERVDLYDVGIYSQTLGTSGATGTRTATNGSADIACSNQMLAFGISNELPNAPVLTSPTGNAVLDRSTTTTLRWTHSDPDGDTQADAEVRYKLVGGSWTTVTGKGTSSFHSLSGGTLAAGNWEWQARTSDAEGFGPWSSSAYFTASDKPAAPTITAPTSGATIPDGEEDVTLTHADSPEYVQVQVVATDGTTVVTDTGAIAWTTTVSDVGFPVSVNGTTVTLRARVKKDGLWSSWASQSHPVAYTAPATPTITVASLTDGGVPVGIRVSHANPTPSGSEPAVASVEVYRRLGDATDAGIRIATVVPDADFDDYLVASGVDYEYRVIAWSADSIASASAWEDEITVTAELADEDPFIEGESP